MVFTLCTEFVNSPYIEPTASGLPNPTPVEGEVRFIQAPDQSGVSRISLQRHGFASDIKHEKYVIGRSSKLFVYKILSTKKKKKKKKKKNKKKNVLIFRRNLARLLSNNSS